MPPPHARTWRNLGTVGVEQLHAERAVGGARLQAEAGIVVQQHMRVGRVDRIRKCARRARALVAPQLQQLLRSRQQDVSDC